MQTMHLFGSSVMTQRNHILYSTKQYFQKAYKLAMVIVLLTGKQSWTDAKQCTHRWTWYASQSHSNLGPRTLNMCSSLPGLQSHWLGWLLTSRHQLLPDARNSCKIRRKPPFFKFPMEKELLRGNREQRGIRGPTLNWDLLLIIVSPFPSPK